MGAARNGGLSRTGTLALALAITAGLAAAPMSAKAVRPLATRTFTPDFTAAGTCNSIDEVTVRLPRRAQRVRVLRPKVGRVFRDAAYDVPAATLTRVRVGRREVLFRLIGDRACSEPLLADEGWGVDLAPVIRYRRREPIYFTGTDLEPSFRPRIVYIGASQRIYSLRWRRWGHRVAHGRGTFPVNDCNPNCASGNIIPRPVRVRLSRARMCAGQLEYLRLDYSIAGDRWRGFSNAYVCRVLNG